MPILSSHIGFHCFSLHKSSKGMPHLSNPETPLRKEVRHFFADHLSPKEKVPQAKRRCVDIHATGEALTNDSFLRLSKEAEAEKQASASRRTIRKRCNLSAMMKMRMSIPASLAERMPGETLGWLWWVLASYRWYHKCAGFTRWSKLKEVYICKFAAPNILWTNKLLNAS